MTLTIVPPSDHRRLAASMIEERESPRKSVETSGSSDDAEDALHRAGRGGAERVVELLDGRRARDVGGEVDDADGRRRHAQAEAVELALEVRDHERERLRGAGRGRDDVLAGRAGAARVLVRDVQDALVVRVAVDRVHQAALDAEQVVDDLGGRRQAVRRAAGVADDVVRSPGRSASSLTPRTIVMSSPFAGALMITLRAPAVEVRAGLLGVGEQAGRLEDDVDAEVAPRQRRRVLLLRGP